MSKHSVPDMALKWLTKIQQMTDAERDKVRSEVAEGSVLTIKNVAKRAAMRVYDQQVKEQQRLANISKNG